MRSGSDCRRAPPSCPAAAPRRRASPPRLAAAPCPGHHAFNIATFLNFGAAARAAAALRLRKVVESLETIYLTRF